MKLWSSRRGTTLVEILVAMLVLLVGIMTIIQLFPTGFRVVRAAESQTIATRLAQQEIERWKNMVANLPAGILPVDENGNVLNTQPPGPPFEDYRRDGNGDLVITNGWYERGNVYNTRQVVGESTLIPMGSYFRVGAGSIYGSRYALAFSPIDAWLEDGKLKGITIKSGDLRRRYGSADDDPPYLRTGEYAVDYEVSVGQDYPDKYVFHVAFPRDASPRRIYYVSFSYWYAPDSNAGTEPEMLSLVDQLVVRNGQTAISGDDTDWIEVPIRDVNSNSNEVVELEERTDTCARGFLEQPGDWSDLYEFKLVDSILGVVAFNPRGHGMFERTARGTRPVEARITYFLNDPRILREDRVIPQPDSPGAPIPTKLALRFILNIGDATDELKPAGNPPEPEPQDYQGLVRDHYGNVAVTLPMLVMDVSTGWRVNVPANAIDFDAGVVELPATANLVDYTGAVMANVPLAGRNLRFFYRAEGDWAVQCHKAYYQYTRKYGVNDSLDYRSYKIVGNAGTPSNLGNRLVFAPCEGLKTVAVDYTYVDANGVERKVVGEEHQIDYDQARDVWCVDLKIPAGGYIPTAGRVVVIGTSFTARVTWRDGKNWRHVDMDTQLVKS